MYIIAAFEDSFGYGSFINNIIRHLISRGVDVKLTPLFGMEAPVDLRPFIIPANKRPKVHDVMFCSVSNCPTDAEATVLFTMTESTELPWEHGAGLKRFKHVITPTKFSADAMRPWNKRVHICQLGADMLWSPTPFSPFTFTVVATDHLVPERKRVQEVVDIFQRTFPTEIDVHLQLKRSPDCIPATTFDKRIGSVHARLPRSTYIELMHKTTVGIQPSAMEGWSLPTNEFMAMGRPVILPVAGAMADYVDPRAVFPVDFTMRRTPKMVYLGRGKAPWADMAGIGRQMRFAYDNKFEVVKRGIAAYECAQKFTVHAMGERFYNLCQTILS